MERSSTPKSIRAEREAANSPYDRSLRVLKPKQSVGISPFASLRSLYSFVTGSISRTTPLLPNTSQDIDSPPASDQQSVSGSDDEWEGEEPKRMQGEDVFSLAAAAGRKGGNVDDRALEFRARGEIPGGRRDLARRALEGDSSLIDHDEPQKPVYTPQQNHKIRPFSSTPVVPTIPSAPLPSTNLPPTTPVSGVVVSTPSRKRPHSPVTRNPLPSFLPSPSTTSKLTSSASSAALSAFLDAKKGSSMSSEDIRVVDALVDSIKHETEPQTGGWGAGEFNTPSRSIRPLRETVSTPVRSSPFANGFNSPGPSFSIGASPSTLQSPSRRKLVYLGPGMSPRKMGRSRINFDESPAKKVRTETMELDQSASYIPPSSLTTDQSQSSISNVFSTTTSPTTALPLTLNKVKSLRTFAPSNPSPLGRNTMISDPSSPPAHPSTSVKATAVSLGKHRAANIMRELLAEDLATVSARVVEDFIVNPYDTTSLLSKHTSTLVPHSVPSTPSTPHSRNHVGSVPNQNTPGRGTPNRPTIRALTDTTPKRGAAAKLAATKSQKLTTLELLSGKKPYVSSSLVNGKGKKREDAMDFMESEDDEEVDELFGSPEPDTPISKGDNRKDVEMEEESSSSLIEIPGPDPVPKFDVPQLSISTFNTTPFKSTTTTKELFSSASQNSIFPSVKPDQVFKPTFTPTPISQSMEEGEHMSSSTPVSETIEDHPVDLTAIYLSAKDAALKVEKPALPFYTFNISTTILKPSDDIRTRVMKRSLQSYSFTLHLDPEPAADVTPLTTTGEEWTCDLCMLKNPASASEKCTICEAPKPAKQPTSTKPSLAFGIGMDGKSGTKGGEWTCSLCMLKNPESAKDKCGICEAPRPT
ncbi:hypothetical protein TREMEDRAFT_72658 [Tremella mesenterica DSM 1558]|uniref:uncharacterized protein n=1 Tax=Tremella mesenterica (strain ATCC 24925 / CBS 8224 / DSM 1558 / NBRC 9311 / NRRL Y-6157 / RJB 2259-6 / UBC 559-6) TaxID=578456 RepID=UPI0003F49008|nr:uncharacterized protein TREMEDRAFT_72658 [Tremella mesenterica DSM 1558]EIW72110.1 hypothetical protein TREMEDRAFT_72658 [Tremella mesenterica DSM 1558]